MNMHLDLPLKKIFSIIISPIGFNIKRLPRIGKVFILEVLSLNLFKLKHRKSQEM